MTAELLALTLYSGVAADTEREQDGPPRPAVVPRAGWIAAAAEESPPGRPRPPGSGARGAGLLGLVRAFLRG